MTPGQRRLVVIAMLLLHAVAAAWLVLLPERASPPPPPTPVLRVDWIAAPQPIVKLPPVPPHPTPPQAMAPQRSTVIAAPDVAVVSAVTAPPPEVATVVDTAPVTVDIAPAAPVPAPPAAVIAAAPLPAPPKTLPPEAVQYLVPPAPVYPKLARRLGESGRVLVRVYIDEGGQPRSVLVSESSGHARLDDAARAAVQLTRFKPYSENGRPTAGWAFIPLTFDLEN